MRKEVTCKNATLYNRSISMLFGKSPKVKIICGDCGYYFTERFDMYEIEIGTPRTICPYCGTINKIPISVK